MDSEDHKSKLIEFFTRHADNGTFDTYTGEQVEHIVALLDDVHFPLNEPLTVLDCGCGSGRSSRLLAKRLGEGSKVTGMDLTPGMIEHARKIGTETDIGSVEFVTGDCLSLSFDDETFDWIVVLDSFPHFGDNEFVFWEFLRVLKDGGFMAILGRDSSTEINSFHESVGEPVASDMIPDMKTMLLLLKDAGFWVMVYVDDDDGFRLMARK